MDITPGNQVTLFKNGGELFPAMIAAIDAAQFEVRVETYIFRDDKSGDAIADSLKHAAKRGVAVRVLVDGLVRIPPARNFLKRCARLV
jgi:cardiolipin synthase A/B